MSTSQSGQIRLVYLCDPGKVPPMQMVHSEAEFPDFIRDKLNKTFNEIMEIENNNYPNTKYQDLNLVDEYLAETEAETKEADIEFTEHNEETDSLWQEQEQGRDDGCKDGFDAASPA